MDAIAWIAVGAFDEAQRQLMRASAVWATSRSAFTFQDLCLLYGETALAIARGELRAAFTRAHADLARYAESPLRASTMFAAYITDEALRATAALAATVRGTERAELLRTARGLRFRDIAGGAHLPYQLWQTAVIAALEGRSGAAVAALRGYLAFPTHPVLAQATRRQLGRLIGGDEGNALVAEADTFFLRGGAVDPQRLADVLSPGFAASS